MKRMYVYLMLCEKNHKIDKLLFVISCRRTIEPENCQQKYNPKTQLLLLIRLQDAVLWAAEFKSTERENGKSKS